MNNYSNNKPHDPHGFKEEVKIKYDVVKVIAGNGTAAMIELLGIDRPALDWVAYCAMPPVDHSYWKREATI